MKLNQDILLTLNSTHRKKIVAFFLRHDLAVSEREIGKLLAIPSMTTHRILKDLEAFHFIQISRVGTANVWKVNKKSYAFRVFEQWFHVYKDMRSPVDTLKSLVQSIFSDVKVERVILFGSVAQGQEKENSDIDLCILVQSEKDKKRLDSVIDQLSLKCLDLFGNRLEAYVWTKREYSMLQNKKLLQAIQHGIELIHHERET